jgi:hypothetical protein
MARHRDILRYGRLGVRLAPGRSVTPDFAVHVRRISAAEYFRGAFGQRQLKALLKRNIFSGLSELAPRQLQ